MKWLLKTQQISLFFEDIQGNVEEILELSHKLLGELQSPLLKIYIYSQQRKELEQICLKLLLQRLGKLLVDVKNSNNLQKFWNKKHFGNNWEVEKRNTSVELVDLDPFLETIISSDTREVFPSTSLDESSIEFEFKRDRNLYLDRRDTHLDSKLQLFKGRLFDAFKKK